MTAVLVLHRSPPIRDGIVAALRQRLLEHRIIAVSSCAELVDLAVGVEAAAAVIDEDSIVSSDRLTESLDAAGVAPVVIMQPGRDPMPLLELGARAIVLSTDGLGGLVIGVSHVLQGHAYVPPHLLGSVLRDLIVQRRQAEERTVDPLDRLSARERQVLVLLVSGADHREIASALVISPHTSKTHINRVLRKLGVRSRVEATALAVAHGLYEGGHA